MNSLVLNHYYVLLQPHQIAVGFLPASGGPSRRDQSRPYSGVDPRATRSAAWRQCVRRAIFFLARKDSRTVVVRWFCRNYSSVVRGRRSQRHEGLIRIRTPRGDHGFSRGRAQTTEAETELTGLGSSSPRRSRRRPIDCWRPAPPAAIGKAVLFAHHVMVGDQSILPPMIFSPRKGESTSAESTLRTRRRAFDRLTLFARVAEADGESGGLRRKTKNG